MGKSFDCSGWATKANMRCADGRIIMKNAFKECDGMTVPVVWNHQHNSVDEVLGHALLENRDEGVYAYVNFNDTESGQNAKLVVQHGDVNRFSIYANKLKQQGSNVIHGVIRELSLVLAGANPGAVIETVMMHGEDSYEEGYITPDIIYCIENVEPLFHADTEKKGEEEMAKEITKPEGEETIKDVFDTLTEKQKKAVYAMIGMALEDDNAKGNENENKKEKEVKHAEQPTKDDENETVEDVFNTLTEKQKKVVYAIIGQALEDAGVDIEDDEEDEGGNANMKHNVFDKEIETNEVLTHSEMTEIFEDAKRCGSLKDAVLQHGIEHIDYLFPDAKNIDSEPGFKKRDDSWVADVMNSVHKTPFARIKSIFADITEADARARGYIKGNKKVDEVFTLLKRITTPTTIYKKQKLDRDDVIDITDFDVIAWLKSEMRMMLDEEIARAILVGDGRMASSDDKINEQNIRPILNDADLFTIRWSVAAGSSDDDKAKNFIRAAIKSRKNYKGSGNPVLFTTEDMLTDMLLLEDTIGHKLYKTEAELATALRVTEIVTVPVMENLTDKDSKEVYGIIVNLSDYNVGADKGGAVNMFDDFDIDYNQQKYLIETRCSGALIKPFSAIVLRAGSATQSEEPGLASAKAALNN